MADINESQNHDDQVVVDSAKSRLSDLWKLEDCWCIWLGFLILVISLIIYLPAGTEEVSKKINESNAILKNESERAPFKTTAWYIALDNKAKLKATDSEIGKEITNLTSHPKKWSKNPFDAFFSGEEETNLIKQDAEKKFFEPRYSRYQLTRGNYAGPDAWMLG